MKCLLALSVCLKNSEWLDAKKLKLLVYATAFFDASDFVLFVQKNMRIYVSALIFNGDVYSPRR